MTKGSSRLADLLAELRRRRVFKVVGIYAVVAWLVIQVAATTFPYLDLPASAVRLVIVLALIGLPIAIACAWAFQLTPEGIQRSDRAEADGSTSHTETRSGNPLIAAATALLVVALLATAGYALMNRTGAAPRGKAAVREASIAVLPFANLSEQAANAYFADGVAEDILTQLSKVGRIRVISRAATMSYKGTTLPLRQIASELNVATLLSGSIQRDGNRIRIAAELTDAATQTAIWSKRFDREVTDVFAVQTEIASEIASALSAELTPRDSAQIAVGNTSNVAAYDLLLKSREYLGDFRVRGGREKPARAVALLQQALNLDPQFSLAVANLSSAYLMSGMRDSAFTAARRAIDMAPDMAEGHSALAGAYRIGGQFREALAEARVAVKLNPNDAAGIGEIAYMLGELGSPDESLPWAKRLIAVEPTRARGYTLLADSYVQLGGLDEAERWARKALEVEPRIGPAYSHLANVALRRGDRTRVKVLADSLWVLPGARGSAVYFYRILGDMKPVEQYYDSAGWTTNRSVGALVMRARNRPAEAERLLVALDSAARDRIRQGDQVRGPSSIFARIAAARGNRVETIKYLRELNEHGVCDPWDILLEPQYDLVKGEPEFKQLIEEMKQKQAAMRARAVRERWW